MRTAEVPATTTPPSGSAATTRSERCAGAGSVGSSEGSTSTQVPSAVRVIRLPFAIAKTSS
jgi:hypothetical protein